MNLPQGKFGGLPNGKLGGFAAHPPLDLRRWSVPSTHDPPFHFQIWDTPWGLGCTSICSRPRRDRSQLGRLCWLDRLVP